MIRLNQANIADYFMQLTGISADDFSQQAIIDNSARYIESRLIPEELTEEQQERCEYAAAVHGVYDYILTRNLAEKVLVSQNGNAVNQGYEDYSISAAFELKKSVLGSLGDIINNNSFSFFATGGK